MRGAKRNRVDHSRARGLFYTALLQVQRRGAVHQAHDVPQRGGRGTCNSGNTTSEWRWFLDSFGSPARLRVPFITHTTCLSGADEVRYHPLMAAPTCPSARLQNGHASIYPHRAPSRSTPPPWGSIRLRLALRTYDAPPWGVRVVSQTACRSQEKYHPEKYYFSSLRAGGAEAGQAPADVRLGGDGVGQARHHKPPQVRIHGPFDSTPMGVNSISFGSPHARCTPT